VDSSYLGRLHPKTAIYGRIYTIHWSISNRKLNTNIILSYIHCNTHTYMYILHNIRGTFVLPCEKTSDSNKNYHETDIFKIQDFMTDNNMILVFSFRLDMLQWILFNYFVCTVTPTSSGVSRVWQVGHVVYSIQYYVIKFVSHLRQVGGFL
jgi:hypothetical protein